MPRPKKSDHERRDLTARVRLNTLEHAEFEQSASMAGMTLSDFFRSSARAAQKGHRLKSTSKLDRDQMDKASVALLRLGVNLNQLTKHVNAGRSVPHGELAALITRINTAMDALDESRGDRPGAQL